MYCNELHCLPAIPKPAGLFSGSAKATLIRWTRCLLTVNKTNFGIINIFVSPSHRRHLFHFLYRNNPCCNSGGVSLFGLVVLCMPSENMGRARSIVCLLFQTRDPEYVIRLSAGQPDRLDLDVVTICLMDPGGDAWRVLGLRPHLTTSNHICLLLLYKQHTT